MKSTFIILSTLLVFFIGCDTFEIAGPAVIIEKKYIPSHIDFQYMPVPVGIPSGIKDYRYVPYPDEWWIICKVYNKQGESRTIRFQVSRKKYEMYSIGDKIFVN